MTSCGRQSSSWCIRKSTTQAHAWSAATCWSSVCPKCSRDNRTCSTFSFRFRDICVRMGFGVLDVDCQKRSSVMKIHFALPNDRRAKSSVCRSAASRATSWSWHPIALAASAAAPMLGLGPLRTPFSPLRRAARRAAPVNSPQNPAGAAFGLRPAIRAARFIFPPCAKPNSSPASRRAAPGFPQELLRASKPIPIEGLIVHHREAIASIGDRGF
jgi:hypothetical protein